MRNVAEFGTPFRLPRSGAWLLRRPIPGTDLTDATGPYPVLACPAWERLAADLSELRDVVSVVDLGVPAERRISANHRRNLRRVPRALHTERVDHPAERLSDWDRLYAVLVARHNLRGVAAFSAASFAAQFRVPGLRVWRAVSGGVTVGMVLWFVHGGVAHYHLTAADATGYRSRCVFALVRNALDDLAAEGVQRADLGGAAGLTDDAGSGLASFKRGWSTGTVDAYLCGRIVDRAAYARLAGPRNTASANGVANGVANGLANDVAKGLAITLLNDTAYFPAYRAAPSPRAVRDDPTAEPVAV